MITAMLDTNIWLDFALIKMKENEGQEIHEKLIITGISLI